MPETTVGDLLASSRVGDYTDIDTVLKQRIKRNLSIGGVLETILCNASVS